MTEQCKIFAFFNIIFYITLLDVLLFEHIKANTKKKILEKNDNYQKILRGTLKINVVSKYFDCFYSDFNTINGIRLH